MSVRGKRRMDAQRQDRGKTDTNAFVEHSRLSFPCRESARHTQCVRLSFGVLYGGEHNSDAPAQALELRCGSDSRAVFFAPLVAQINPLAGACSRQNQHIGHNKHPVAQKPAIDNEARLSRQLPGEQPFRQPLGAARAPLGVDLAADREQQYCGSAPADSLGPHVRGENPAI